MASHKGNAAANEARGVPEVDQLGSTVDRESSLKTKRKQGRGGRRSRDKGNRAERWLVNLLQEHGLAAERVPFSGSAGGSYLGDLTVPLLGFDRTVEVKCRAAGFRQLYQWLEQRDVLVIKADRQHAIVVLPIRLAIEIAAEAERVRS
jgi:Holliday junction resolvase